MTLPRWLRSSTGRFAVKLCEALAEPFVLQEIPDQAQEYFMSRPVPAAELETWLSTWQSIDELAEAPKILPLVAFG